MPGIDVQRRWLPLFALALGCLLLAGERVRGIAWNTALLSISAAAVAVPIGTLVALALVKTTAPARHGMLAAFGVLMFMPLYLHVAGWQAALGVGGWVTGPSQPGLNTPWLDGWRAAIWIHAMAAVPWVVCIVAAGLRGVPASLEEAASLVASPRRVLWSITLPAAAPAVGVAILWTILTVAAEMTVTDFFQIRTFAEEVYTTAAAGGFQTDKPEDDYRQLSAWLQSTGLVAGVVLLASFAGALLLRLVRWLKTSDSAMPDACWRWRWHTGRWIPTSVALALLLLVAGLPVVSLIHKAGLGSSQIAGEWYRVWTFAELRSELMRSVSLHSRELSQTIVLGLGVATAATTIGALAGWRLRTSRRTPYFVGALFALAVAVPGPLIGLTVIRFLNHPADSWMFPLTWAYDNTLLAPWLAQTIRITPAAALIATAGFASLPNSLLDAAATDGAGWWRKLVWIGLPQALPMIAVAWLVSLALSAGELATAVLVMPPGPPTLTIRLFTLLHYGVEDQVAAISLVFLAVVSLIAAIAVWLFGRSRRSMRDLL